MLPADIRQSLEQRIAAAPHPRELVVDIMYALQRHHGYLNDEGVHEAAALLGLDPVEVEELATFYDFIYRRPVGRYVIHLCDGLVCWMFDEQSALAYLCKRLGVEPGQTTADGLFTVLPSACIGYCDHAPAMLVNGKFYGPMDPAAIDRLVDELRNTPCDLAICR